MESSVDVKDDDTYPGTLSRALLSWDNLTMADAVNNTTATSIYGGTAWGWHVETGGGKFHVFRTVFDIVTVPDQIDSGYIKIVVNGGQDVAPAYLYSATRDTPGAINLTDYDNFVTQISGLTTVSSNEMIFNLNAAGISYVNGGGITFMIRCQNDVDVVGVYQGDQYITFSNNPQQFIYSPTQDPPTAGTFRITDITLETRDGLNAEIDNTLLTEINDGDENLINPQITNIVLQGSIQGGNIQIVDYSTGDFIQGVNIDVYIDSNIFYQDVTDNQGKASFDYQLNKDVLLILTKQGYQKREIRFNNDEFIKYNEITSLARQQTVFISGENEPKVNLNPQDPENNLIL